MATETLGLRRLYGAPGFHFAEVEQFEHGFQFDDEFSVSVVIGPRPSYGFLELTGDTFYEPGGSPVEMKAAFHSEPSETLTGFRSYTEITVTYRAEMDDALSGRFRSGADAKADNEVMGLIQQRKPALGEVADIVAGNIGLRIHRQLVFRLLNEHTIALREKDQLKGDFSPGVLEMLDDVRVRSGAIGSVRALIEKSAMLSPKDREFARDILFWLMRAWKERDSVNAFLAYFVPLELILDAVSVPTRPSKDRISEFREAIGEALPEFLPDFELLAAGVARPSLNERFREFAQALAFKGWEKDVETFRELNRDRNKLLHGGFDGVRLVVHFEEHEVRRMQDLVERYVSGRLFGDEAIYASSFRLTRWPPVDPEGQ